MSDTTDFDTDGNQPDAMSFDADGDGYAETTVVDTDHDGIADTFIEEDPYSGGMIVAADTDGDGVVDTVAADYDGDGIIDEAITDDGGGTDTFVDDGPDDGTTDYSDDGSFDGPFPTDEGTTDDPTLDPGTDEGMHGDPPGDMTYHQTQPGPVDCLPTSVAMTLSELTGTDIPAGDLVEMANANGFMGDSGMAAEDALTLFESYGVEADLTSGTVDDLRTALDNGDSIVVGIDSADLYAGDGGPFDQGLTTGHAVVITGIDDGPPGSVYINDPGFPDGAGVEIPLDQFIDSWEDTDNTMIVAEPIDAAADDSATTAETAATDVDTETVDAFQRMILLPLNFVVGA